MCEATTTPPPDSNFPKGFDYPQDVHSWVHMGGGGRVRLHGWCLFAGLNQQAAPNGPFNWQSWETSTQAFPYQYNQWKGLLGAALPNRPVTLNSRNRANAKVGGPNAINNPAPAYPINPALVTKYKSSSCLAQLPNKANLPWYQLKDGDHLQSNGDIMVAGVIYNAAAINWIRRTRLYDAVALNGLLPKDKNARSNTIPDFPASSIVLKPMFWPVKKDGFTVLPVWDWDANKPGSASDDRYAGYEIQSLWKRAVAITTVPSVPPSKLDYLYGVYDSTESTNPKLIGPITYDSTAFQVASVNDFYHRQLNQAELNALSVCDRALLDASAYWAYNRAFEPGDYVVLIAMHIMTKEQPEWTFQSLWWQPDADNSSKCGRYCGDRPTIPGDTTFQHYLLTTTYGTIQQTPPPPPAHPNYYSPQGAILPVAYNPYIELAASHPITTNCMNCHHRAAWPPLASMNKPDEGRTSSYLQDSPGSPNVLETFQWDAPIFNGLVKLDAMWAVSDRAGYPAGATKKK
jgi:hypothetical protein